MDYATALQVWDEFRFTSLVELKQDLIDVAVRYARLRVDWLLAEGQKQTDIDQDRTRCHNSLIAACDILSRNMETNGEDGSWRKALGDDRRQIGDFACMLHCHLGISAR